jgi:hypothetical protein
MANYLSDRLKKLQVGISGYTDSTDVANIIGNTSLDGSLYLKGSLQDKDGQAGTSGEILASTGTGVEWIGAPPGGISVYDENTLIGSTFGTTSLKFVGNYISASISGSTATVTLSDLSLDNLTDVVISSPSNNQLVRYNNSNTRWENWTPNFTLGTDTTGNYVESLVAGTGVTLTNGTASEGGTPTISIGQSVGTTDNVTFNNLTISGTLTVNGTSTTINSTITTIDDPIITLGGDTAPTTDDSKDRGIEFRWHDGTNAKVGFFGFDDSSGYLTYIPDASNSSEVFSGTPGDIQATNFRGALIGNADTATKWSTKRTLTISGDVSGTATDIDGSGNISITSTLASSGVTAGTYNSVTVDSKGRVTSGSNPTTLGGYGIVDALTTSSTSTQSGYFGDIYLYDDSTPSHYLQVTNSANLTDSRTLSINVNDSNRTISLSGNLTVSSAATISGTNTGDQTIELTGDVTGSGTGSFSTTLANSGVTAGTYNSSATAITPFTVDSKGRITSTGSAVTVTPAFSSITSTPTTLTGYGITDALSNSTTSTQSGYFGNIYLYDDSTPSHYLEITNSANLTAQRSLSINVNDADRNISLSGNLTVSSAATISGTNTGDQTINLTGDVTGSGSGSFSTTLANSGVTAGTYTSVTVDTKGRVTSGSNPTTTGSGSGVLSDSPSFTTLVNLNNRAELRFLEASENGTNYVGFEAPANITANKIWLLPNADGTAGQALVTDGSGNLSWATAGGGGVDGGAFNTGITSSIYVSVTGGVGTTVATLNDITTGPGIAYTFPSTAGKKYIIESIHVSNSFSNELYFVARHDFNGGSNVPLAQRVIVPYQGAMEFLDQPIIANPSDTIRFQALSNTSATAIGIDGGLDAFIIISEKTDTTYIGTGGVVSTATGTQIFQATTGSAMLQSIKLCNYSLNTDIDASISIYRGTLASGVRLGYLAYNITIPKNSVIELLVRPKYLATNDSIVASASLANVLAVTLSGKYI